MSIVELRGCQGYTPALVLRNLAFAEAAGGERVKGPEAVAALIEKAANGVRDLVAS